jgi:hypothetical protein
MNKILVISEEFLRQAHSAACADWKLKIEKEFPSVFKSKLESYLHEFGTAVYDAVSLVYHAKIVKDADYDYVLIPLPNGNADWTLSAWDYAKRLIKSAPPAINICPIHYKHFGDQEFPMINREYKGLDGKTQINTSDWKQNYIVLKIFIKK